MESLIVGLNVVVPLVILMGLGYFLRIMKLVDEQTVSRLNSLVFRLFLPVLIFKNIYNINPDNGIDSGFIGFGLLMSLTAFLLIFIVIVTIEKEHRKTGILIQGIFRSNFVIFGIPVIASLFGDENLGIPSLAMAMVVPVYNFLAVIVLTIFGQRKIEPRKIVLDIIKNPLIVATVIGMMFLVMDFRFHPLIYGVIDDISKVATPLSLIVLGASFVFRNIAVNLKQVLIGVFGRLVFVPLIFVGISIMAGFRNLELATFMVMFGTPTAVSSYTMAKEMGGDENLACSLVVLQTIFSVVTIFLMTTVLTHFGYIIPR